ncbi:MAG: SRPBCC family protein [Verrucomicrobiota bacterium]|nr:SRPBCC family protein [Verrucomicrobiota bacterium]
MRWILGIFSALIVLTLIAYLAGMMIPAEQTHVRTLTLAQPPEKVFAALADIPNMPGWNHSLEKVEMLPPVDGKEVSRQTFKSGMVMEVTTTQSVPPRHLVRTMGDSGGPFVGSWSYEITPENNGSMIVLTEHSTMKEAMFRVLSQLFGPTKYMDEHLRDLAAHFGERAVIR